MIFKFTAGFIKANFKLPDVGGTSHNFISLHAIAPSVTRMTCVHHFVMSVFFLVHVAILSFDGRSRISAQRVSSDLNVSM